MNVLTMCEWLENTALSIYVRESLYGFAIVVGIHLLSLSVSVGTLVWFDLRLLGISMRSVPVSEVYRRLAPWLLCGFALMFISGVTLFAAFATSAYGNVYFRIKVGALVLAGVNALFYHFTTERSLPGWDNAQRPPARARLAGLVSIAVWVIVILAGRMMSYTMF